MSGNVLINGMTAVHADSGGMLNTIDVCKTQVGPSVVPIPYPNVAQSADADKTADSVKINGKPACIKTSVFSKSVGDEAGSNGGVTSGGTAGAAEFISASSNVFFEGVEAARAMDMMVSNDQNTAPAPLMQPPGPPPQALSAGPPEELTAAESPDELPLALMGANMALSKGLMSEDEPEDEEAEQ